MPRLLPLLAAAVVLAFHAGCDSTAVPQIDGATTPDLSVVLADMSMLADGASGDMTRTGDMAVPIQDLSMVDMARTVGPGPTVIAHQDWINFCLAFSACGLYPPSTNMSFCSRLNPQPGSLSFAPKSILACLTNAGADCVKVKTCLNDGNPNFTCNADAGVQPACTGQVYSVCESGDFRFAVDCSRQGFTCVATPPQMPNASLSGCGFGTCDRDAGTTLCTSGFSASCNTGGRLSAVEDCRVFDTEACNVSDAGVASCVGTGNACMASRCNGTTLVACKGGHEASFDCAIQGLSCVDNGKGAVACAQAAQCDPNSYFETCNGAVLTYCDMGKIATVNCVAAGWKSCVPRIKPDGGMPTGGFCSMK